MNVTEALKTASAVPVACPLCGWDDSGTLEVIDRWREDYPPIPYVKMIELRGDSGEGRPVYRCGGCGEDIDPYTVEAR